MAKKRVDLPISSTKAGGHYFTQRGVEIVITSGQPAANGKYDAMQAANSQPVQVPADYVVYEYVETTEDDGNREPSNGADAPSVSASASTEAVGGESAFPVPPSAPPAPTTDPAPIVVAPFVAPLEGTPLPPAKVQPTGPMPPAPPEKPELPGSVKANKAEARRIKKEIKDEYTEKEQELLDQLARIKVARKEGRSKKEKVAVKIIAKTGVATLDRTPIADRIVAGISLAEFSEWSGPKRRAKYLSAAILSYLKGDCDIQILQGVLRVVYVEPKK